VPSSNSEAWERGAEVATLPRRMKGRRAERIFISAFPDIFEHAKSETVRRGKMML
jgi:hypothetical protein